MSASVKAPGIPATFDPVDWQPAGLPTDPHEIMDAIVDPSRRGELYPLYHQLRRIAPVHRCRPELFHGAWIVTRFDDADPLLKNPRVVNDPAVVEETFTHGDGSWTDVMRNVLIWQHPEPHQRVRNLVKSAFTPRAMAMCECSSMMPQVRCLPVASSSITAGLRRSEKRAPTSSFGPTPRIRPWAMHTSASLSTPSGPFVQTVAWRNTTISVSGDIVAPYAPMGNQTCPVGADQRLSKVRSFLSFTAIVWTPAWRTALQVIHSPPGIRPRPSQIPPRGWMVPFKRTGPLNPKRSPLNRLVVPLSPVRE